MKKADKKKAITFFVLLILVIVLIMGFLLTSYAPKSLRIIDIEGNNYDVGHVLTSVTATQFLCDSEWGMAYTLDIRDPYGIVVASGTYSQSWTEEPDWVPVVIPLSPSITLFVEGTWNIEWVMYDYEADEDGHVYSDAPWAYPRNTGIGTFTVGTITHQLIVGSSPIGCTVTVQSEVFPPDFIETVVSQTGMNTFNVEEGIYIVTVSHEGYTTKTDTVTVLGDTNIMFSLDEIPEPEPEPEPEEEIYTIAVEVFDDITNLPIESAKVTADNIDKFTDSNGVVIYSLEGGGKTYSVSVIASGYNSDLKTITVYDDPETVSFYLTPLEDENGNGNGEEPEPEPESELEPEPATPGFEMFTLIVAIGICLIFFYYKKHKKQ